LPALDVLRRPLDLVLGLSMERLGLVTKGMGDPARPHRR
jgi:hypothetical protein